MDLEPTATVRTSSASYPIYVKPGVLADLGRLLREAKTGRRAVVISDDAVASAHGEATRTSLEDSGFMVEILTIPRGEAAKSLATVETIYDRLVELAVERSDTVIALGGGVVGDVAGFVAATYLRGIPLVHVPTSLLAMADAAIGGKTGVNHARGKNLIGAFYQPLMVVEDPKLVVTLDDRAYREGFAELIKHGLIADLDLLDYLEKESGALLERDGEALTAALAASARVKAAIVSADEREADKRAWLNYGHTVAHAIEAASGYEAFLHGEAVTIGMIAAAAISHKLGILDESAVRRQRQLIEHYGLPTAAEGLPRDRILEAMRLDKKRAHDQQRWVLLDGLANPVVRADVPDHVVGEALASVGIA